jgi:hypothetical protein
VRLSAAAGILFQVNAAWLVWKSTAVPDHKAPDVVHFKTPAYFIRDYKLLFSDFESCQMQCVSPPLKG